VKLHTVILVPKGTAHAGSLHPRAATARPVRAKQEDRAMSIDSRVSSRESDGPELDVLVAGGGSVGLAAAVMLASHGLTVHVVERQQGPAIHPRAGGLGPRTMEILRQLGLADAVRAAGIPPDAGSGRVRAETLAAARLADMPRAATTAIGDASKAFSPEGGVACAQDRLDAVLLDAARARGARVTYGCTVRDLQQREDGITAMVEESSARATAPTDPRDPASSARSAGVIRSITARYVLAADGASSGIRRQLGIDTSGPGPLAAGFLNVLFGADLRALVGDHVATVVQVTHPDAPGLLMPAGVVDRWTFHIDVSAMPSVSSSPSTSPPTSPSHSSSASDAAAAMTPERVRALIRIAIGQPDLDVDILSMLRWTPAGQLADTFRRGDIFLAGDAAHVVPPLGAFGLNLGFADPHNLAWKLALVRRGIAGPALLDSYDAERRAAAQFTVDHALARIRNPELHFDHLQLDSPTFRAARERLGVAHALVVHLGYRYASSAIVSPQPELPSLEDLGRTLDGAPGSRLPHAWIARDGATRSTLDLVRRDRFALLAGPRATRTCAEASAAATRRGLPLDVHQDLDVAWLRSMHLDEDGAMLVRPDGFIAWRQESESESAAASVSMDELLARILHRSAVES
jgi:putative polyketide hydroxylase